MGEYYKTNAVYDEIKKRNNNNFVWAVGNAWVLIYGCAPAEPKIIVFAKGKSWVHQQELEDAVNFLSETSGLPIVHLEFDDQAGELDEVKVVIDNRERKLSLEGLKKLYSDFGLPVSERPVGKAVNDATSSAYHNWQRSALGAGLRVSDIDLIRLGEDGSPIEFIELKRSYYEIPRWSPFSNDYVNFDLIFNSIHKISNCLTIAYNVRRKNPFHDDPSRIKVFSYKSGPQVDLVGIFELEDFLSGKYI